MHGVRHFGPRIRVAYRASHWKRPYLNDIENLHSCAFDGGTGGGTNKASGAIDEKLLRYQQKVVDVDE